MIVETTNLGVRGSNPFGRAISRLEYKHSSIGSGERRHRPANLASNPGPFRDGRSWVVADRPRAIMARPRSAYRGPPAGLPPRAESSARAVGHPREVRHPCSRMRWRGLRHDRTRRGPGVHEQPDGPGRALADDRGLGRGGRAGRCPAAVKAGWKAKRTVSVRPAAAAATSEVEAPRACPSAPVAASLSTGTAATVGPAMTVGAAAAVNLDDRWISGITRESNERECRRRRGQADGEDGGWYQHSQHWMSSPDMWIAVPALSRGAPRKQGSAGPRILDTPRRMPPLDPTPRIATMFAASS